jgi:sodium/pantothenate symporter
VIGVLGKKFAIISRRIQGITILDYLRTRYESALLVIIAGIAIIVFLVSAMIAQWAAGARLLQSIVGIQYEWALTIFALTVLFYVVIGGFKAVVISDYIQAMVMMFGAFVLLIAVVMAGGSIDNLTTKLGAIDPGLISPTGPDDTGILTIAWTFSFWILVGFGVIGIPQVSVRAMCYKDAKSMEKAMVYGTLVVGFLMFCLHIVGAWGQVLIPEVAQGKISHDLIIPELAKKTLSPWLAAVIIAAPFAAVMSTVDSMLILITSTIIKDLYMESCHKKLSNTEMKKMSLYIAVALTVVVTLLALKPPNLIVMINLFAIGGLESGFLWPIVLGLYWKRANAAGALCAMASGIISYTLSHLASVGFFQDSWIGFLFYPPLGTHPVVIPFFVSLAVMIGVSLATKPPRKYILQLYWGASPPEKI